MTGIELQDIQGLIVRGYKNQPCARYVMLHVIDATAAKGWLHKMSELITDAFHRPKQHCMNLAFTPAGLEAIGLSKNNLKNFSREFREGMTTPHRQRLLGDFENSSPDNWAWGGPKNEAVHLLLLLFSDTTESVNAYYDLLKQDFVSSGLKESGTLDSKVLPQNKEHFGFRDGISQPVIAGSGVTGHPFNTVAAGEFILGYKNEYDVFPDTALLADEQGELNLLPADAAGTGKKDLGRNGSYMVIRQIQQDVNAFWSFCNEKTKNEDGSLNTEESIKLASKMFGRWPSGNPLTKHPHKDPGDLTDDDNFEYANDRDGLKCPFGAHIRRINPRDHFEDNNAEKSLQLSKRHRVVRRGKLYGTPFEGSPMNHQPEEEVGLMFVCFNSDISRQFEFLSYTWSNYPNIKQLYNDPDPLGGVRETPISNYEQNFTIQQEPVSKVITGLPRFVRIRGGAYFFFPSVTALRYLATL